MKTIKPAKNNLFCKPDDKEKRTASGIILSEQFAEAPKTATVINVGESVVGYAPDDKIVYKTYSTTDIDLDGTEYFLIAVEDVLGTVVEI